MKAAISPLVGEMAGRHLHQLAAGGVAMRDRVCALVFIENDLHFGYKTGIVAIMHYVTIMTGEGADAEWGAARRPFSAYRPLPRYRFRFVADHCSWSGTVDFAGLIDVSCVAR